MKNKPNFLKNISWIWITIWFLILVVAYSIFNNRLHEKNNIPQLCAGRICFTVELARTQAEQEQWLMYRESMSDNHGMLFVFPKSDLQNFWMKDTLIPLDMVWIDEQFRVVRIMTAQPCIADPCAVYRPEIWAKYVLEINAGIADKYKIVEWSMIRFKNIK